MLKGRGTGKVESHCFLGQCFTQGCKDYMTKCVHNFYQSLAHSTCSPSVVLRSSLLILNLCESALNPRAGLLLCVCGHGSHSPCLTSAPSASTDVLSPLSSLVPADVYDVLPLLAHPRLIILKREFSIALTRHNPPGMSPDLLLWTSAVLMASEEAHY